MNSEQRQQVRSLFEQALDLDPADRNAWVRRAAAADADVCGEVLSLIDHDQRAGNFLTGAIVTRVPELVPDDGIQPGQTIGVYTIRRLLGTGGMGRVYLAVDGRLGRPVALKVLAPELTRVGHQRDRLRREARAAAALTHPGICTVYALDEIGDELVMASEFVDGHTLREEMRPGQSRPGAEVLQTARELAAAVASAHEHGIVHRDLKPENVMRARDGRLKVLDFGLARIEQPAAAQASLRTEPGTIIGTPAYMAPEQLNGQPADASADVFALGVLLYEYACGVHPFQASTPLGTIARVLESQASPLISRCPQLSPGMAEAIDRCLLKAPEQRYRTAGHLADALEHGDASHVQRSVTSWRVHQAIVVALYIVAAATGWLLKEWIENALTVSLFIAMGVGAAIGGVLRGHMLFTERVNRPMLAEEYRRTGRALLALDVAVAVALAIDAVLFSAWPLTAVLTMSLGVGIALAALVLEPATTKATFGYRLR